MSHGRYQTCQMESLLVSEDLSCHHSPSLTHLSSLSPLPPIPPSLPLSLPPFLSPPSQDILSLSWMRKERETSPSITASSIPCSSVLPPLTPSWCRLSTQQDRESKLSPLPWVKVASYCHHEQSRNISINHSFLHYVNTHLQLLLLSQLMPVPSHS